jgi:two-component system phosphate regulon response regulator PhoB
MTKARPHINLKSELTALQEQRHSLSVDEQARRCCALSKRLERIGEYDRAYEALIEFWPDRTKPPRVERLTDSLKAEVFLRAGALAGSLGRADQIEGSIAIAKDLLTKSIEIFEKLEQVNMVAEARGDLALCYWREGAYDEARINLKEALDRVEQEQPELKAVLLIRAGIVEVDSSQFNAAFRFYSEVVPLLDVTHNDVLKGSFHSSFALLFRRLATAQNNQDHIDQALIEYAAASFHFEQAGNHRYLASVENNLGFLYSTIGRYQEAHQHLNRARRLFIELDDIGTVAQVDDARARTMLAEGNLREGERTIKSAVRVLERGGQQALLAEALTTQGTVMARLGNYSRARALLQRAINVAETCGDLEAAGRARLSIIEELNNQTPPRELAEAFHEAAALLEKSQDVAAGRRLLDGGLKTIEALLEEGTEETDLPSEHSWTGFSLKREMKKIEARVIQHALRDAGGSVSKASRMLGFKHHQSLISLLDNRHKDLAGLRSIRRQRRRSLISKVQPTKKTTGVLNRDSAKISVLYVEDHKAVVRLVEELLTGAGIYVDACTSGAAAWETLKSNAHYDALILDNNLPGVSGLELVLRVRSMRERRHLPIIMLSGDDVEKEAWRAGVDAFLRKPEGVERLPSTIIRALNGRRKK